MVNPILEVSELSIAFRGLLALQDISLAMKPGEILGVIGPNGAGKTTLFNCLTGYLSPTKGHILLHQEDITRLPTPAIVRLGMARTFQNIRLFSAQTVLDNVRVAQQMRVKFNPFEVLGGTPSFRQKERQITEQAMQYLEMFGLLEYTSQLAMHLPYGAQRRLEIARALATSPQLLLLDEPAAGMNMAETDALHQMILDIRRKFNLSIILVEHDMRLVMNICERIAVLNYGRVIAEGDPLSIRQNPAVIESYLGKTD